MQRLLPEKALQSKISDQLVTRCVEQGWDLVGYKAGPEPAGIQMGGKS